MLSPRHRPLLFGLGSLLFVWLLAWGGYSFSQSRKMTPERLRSYLQKTDLRHLSGQARARALARLAECFNALTPQERRQARMGGLWDAWWASMSETEKGAFLEATLPTGFKQMITAFEVLPPEKRLRTVSDAIKRLQESRDKIARETEGDATLPITNHPPPAMSAELQKQVTTTGLKTFYSESSAQTKAELAPLLEEMQRLMESGAPFRNGPFR